MYDGGFDLRYWDERSELADQRKYTATMFLTIWQANVFCVVFGSWMFASAKAAIPTTSTLIFTMRHRIDALHLD